MKCPCQTLWTQNIFCFFRYTKCWVTLQYLYVSLSHIISIYTTLYTTSYITYILSHVLPIHYPYTIHTPPPYFVSTYIYMVEGILSKGQGPAKFNLDASKLLRHPPSQYECCIHSTTRILHAQWSLLGGRYFCHWSSTLSSGTDVPPSFSPASIPDNFHISFLSEASKGLEAAWICRQPASELFRRTFNVVVSVCL